MRKETFIESRKKEPGDHLCAFGVDEELWGTVMNELTRQFLFAGARAFIRGALGWFLVTLPRTLAFGKYSLKPDVAIAILILIMTLAEI